MSPGSSGGGPAPAGRAPGAASPCGGEVVERGDAVAAPAVDRDEDHVAQLGERRGRAALPARGDVVEHGEVVERGEAGHRHERAAARLGQHVGQLVAAVQVVERHGDRTGAGDGELQRDELRVVGEEHADVVAGPDAARHEPVGQPRRPRVDVAGTSASRSSVSTSGRSPNSPRTPARNWSSVRGSHVGWRRASASRRASSSPCNGPAVVGSCIGDTPCRSRLIVHRVRTRWMTTRSAAGARDQTSTGAYNVFQTMPA